MTAMLVDENDRVLYYGSVNSDPSGTESSVCIPAGLAPGNYTLRLYGEKWNGAKATNYATGTPFSVDIEIIATNKPDKPGEGEEGGAFPWRGRP